MALPDVGWAGPVLTVLGMGGTWFAAQKFRAGQTAVQSTQNTDTAQKVVQHDLRLGRLEEQTFRADERLKSIDQRTLETNNQVRDMSGDLNQLMGEIRNGRREGR